MKCTGQQHGQAQSRLHFFRIGKRAYAMPVQSPATTVCLNTIDQAPDSKIIVNSLPRPTMESPLSSVILNISNQCNIRCSYCFASEGKYQMQEIDMTYQVAMSAIKLLLDSKSQRLHLRFFGGEPLLRFDLIETVTRQAKDLAQKQGKELTFSVFTNGTVLDEHVISFLNSYQFSIFVSVDGPQKYHDEYRYYPNGKTSYDTIIPKLERLLKSRRSQPVIARAVIPPWRECLTEIVIHLFGLGFDFVSYEHPWAFPDGQFALKSEHIEIQRRQYEELTEWFMERVCSRDFSKIGLEPFWQILKHIPDEKYFVQSCGAGISCVTVSSGGKVYPCHAFVGNDEFLMGYVGEVINQDIKREFVSNITINNDICRGCFVRLFCRSRCHADAYLTNRSIWKPNEYRCMLRRGEFELALHLYVTLRDEHPHILRLLRRLCQRRGRETVY